MGSFISWNIPWDYGTAHGILMGSHGVSHTGYMLSHGIVLFRWDIPQDTPWGRMTTPTGWVPIYRGVSQWGIPNIPWDRGICHGISYRFVGILWRNPWELPWEIPTGFPWNNPMKGVFMDIPRDFPWGVPWDAREPSWDCPLISMEYLVCRGNCVGFPHEISHEMPIAHGVSVGYP